MDELTLDSEENRRRKPDCGVTERGIKQALSLQRCTETGFNGIIREDALQRWRVYCSPMKRCLITCRAMMEGFDKTRGSPPVTVKRSLYESGGCYQLDAQRRVVVGVPGATSTDIESEFGFVCDERCDRLSKYKL